MVDQVQRPELDSFDSLAPLTFDDMPVGEDYISYVPPIEKPSSEENTIAIPEKTPQELINALIKGMPGQRETVLHIIDFCREEQPFESVINEITQFEQHRISVYAPETICANMERAKALVIVDHNEAEGEEDEEFIQATPNTNFGYLSTPEAIEILEQDDPAARLAELLDEDAKYLPVYVQLLNVCSCDGGLTKKDIDALIDCHPLCAKPRVYSGRFVKNLESVHAITFDGRWKITEVGRELLATQANAGSKEGA